MAEHETLTALSDFVESRDWAQFHTPENLAKSISIESAELLELFQWGQDANTDELVDELADVLTYCFLLAHKIGVSPEEIILNKLRKTEEKYPVEKAKGKSTKYDRL
ncbi:MAG: nucleotide pyrophosphohydrolase [Micrococcales bacterium]|nr:nucleotide pyrophosphohydrolase [Micrococcales bacterium]